MRVEGIQGGMNFNGTVTVSKELSPKLAKYMSLVLYQMMRKTQELIMQLFR